MSPPENFNLERSTRWLLLAAPWIMLTLAMLAVSLPFWPDDGRPRNETFLLGFSIVTSVAFGLGAWFSWKLVCRLPEAALSIDDTGLWPSVRNRSDSLVPWSSIVRLRERPFLQRLEAIDQTGTTVAKLEYQLKEFHRLRAIALQRANLDRTTPLSSTYQKSMWHHVVSVGSIVGFALLGLYVGQFNPLVGYAGMALVVATVTVEYWSTPFRLRFTHNALEIQSPSRVRRIPRNIIAKVEIQDEVMNQIKHPAVVLHLIGGGKPVKLKALGVQAVELNQAIQRWHSDA